MTIKNGDLPAMPIYLTDAIMSAAENGAHDVVERVSGLKKREIFAAIAMQGLLSSLTNDDDLTPAQLAKASVMNADALLAELEKSK